MTDYTIQGTSKASMGRYGTTICPNGAHPDYISFKLADYDDLDDRIMLDINNGPGQSNLGIYLYRNKLPLDWQACKQLLVVYVKPNQVVVAQNMDHPHDLVTRCSWYEVSTHKLWDIRTIANPVLEFGLMHWFNEQGNINGGQRLFPCGNASNVANMITPMIQWS